MKTLSLQRPLVMMVVGLPGAGKSFFARQFAETFGVACVRADRIRYELFAEPQYSADENEIVSRIGDYMISELAKTGRSFIVDGGCEAKTARLQIEQVAKNNGYKTLVIWVQTDPTTAKVRAARRNPKKVDDLYNSNLSASQYEQITKRFVPPTKEQYVVISGMHAYSTQARTVLKRLASPRVETATEPKDQKVRQVTKLSRPETSKPTRRGVVIR